MSKVKFGVVKENYLIIVESRKDMANRVHIPCDKIRAKELFDAFEVALMENAHYERGWNFILTDTTMVTMIREADYKFLGGIEEPCTESEDEDEDENDDLIDKDEDLRCLIDPKKFNPLISALYSEYKNGKKRMNSTEKN